jgi:hypothetical protein
LRQLDVDLHHARRVARDFASTHHLLVDADRLLESGLDGRGEAEAPAQADHGPGGDLVGERGDEAAVHHAGRALVAGLGGEAGDDAVAVLEEAEVKANRVLGAAPEAGRARAEEVGIEGD